MKNPILLTALVCAFLTEALAGPAHTPAHTPGFDKDVRGNLLIQSTFRQKVRDGLDAENLLGIPQQDHISELRINLRIENEFLQLRVYPRLLLGYADWNDETWQDHKNTRAKPRFQELNANLTLSEHTFISYGIQPVLWGNAFLFSPSNPFTRETGRLDPLSEPAPADYLKIQWLPDPAWAFELLAQTRRGETQPPHAFSNTYALKTDYLDSRHQLSVILALRDNGEEFGGFFVSRDFGDALQAHLEAGGDSLEQSAVIGLRYTTANRWILSSEFAHQTRGNRDEPLEKLLRPPSEASEKLLPTRERIPRILQWAGTRDGEAPYLSSTTFANLLPLRKNYLLLQALRPQWGGRYHTLLQYARGIDDSSGSIMLHQEAEVGTRTKLFFNATLFHGGRESEWGALLETQLHLGLHLMF